MNYSDYFRAIVRQTGQQVEVWREGVLLGTGYARIEPAFDREDQFQPTDLGLRRKETQICYGEPDLPLAPAPGETLVKAGGDTYRVLSSRPMKEGPRRVFWRTWLEWRGEDEP